jgi:Cof subfamily protein (haloacid dehalogenase superfamily)
MKENKNINEAVRTVASITATDIRLLVLDLDGTIVDDSNRIRGSVLQAIHSAQHHGVAVAIATGRLYQNSLHAHNSIGSTLPLICYEGALIREPNTGFVHRHWPLAPRVAAQMVDYTERLSLSGRLSVHFHIQDNLYVSNLNSASIKYLERSEVEPIVVNDLRQLLNRATTKLMVLSDDVQVIAQLSSRLKNSYSRTQVKQDKSITLLEAFDPAVNKRLAVSYLAEEILALRAENVMAVGDDLTDIEMLRYAGIGVAMGNAPVAVKACADWVTTTIEEDGVARAVERWILRAKDQPRSGKRSVAHSVSHGTRERQSTPAPAGAKPRPS